MTTSALLLASLTWWAVEPMSPKMRLPDVEPADGVKGGAVQVLAAKGEYESGSFVLKSDADLSGLELVWGDPAFYAAVVKAWVSEREQAALGLMKRPADEVSDEEYAALADRYLRDWADPRLSLNDLRVAWLDKKFFY